MKWLFILFLICNIAFFAYSNFFSVKSIVKNTTENPVSENQIIRLSEIDPSELKKIKTSQQTVVEPEKNSIVQDTPSSIDRSNKVVSSQCFKLGPIAKTTMDDLRFYLENKYSNYISFEIETTSPITYHRIYIPPQQSQSVIDKILKKLDENDLNDHYVMSIDGRKNAIALGVFKKRETAEKIAVKVKYLGYSTTIEAITKDKNSLYNLRLEFKNNQDLSFYEQFLTENNLKSLACKNND